MRGSNAFVLWAVVMVAALGCDEGSSNSAGTGGSGGTGGTSDGGDVTRVCAESSECDDGLFCNGIELCVAGACTVGTAPDCDDGIGCTADRCDEELKRCVQTAPDRDRDGHGDVDCVDGDGNVLGDDCDDADSTRYPGAIEICDADDHDEDCNSDTFGRVDYDNDGYLNSACCNVKSDGSTVCGTDCDDFNPRVHPNNTEACDGLDNDCNGLLDHPREDQDHDGYATIACGGTDCDDLNPDTYAGAIEICDGFDNDCIQGGGLVDDEKDLDADGFVRGECVPNDEAGLGPSDCDDDRPSASPVKPELCNGRDDDCDLAIDEDLDCSGRVKQVDANYLRTCTVRIDGTVACWGRNVNGRLGVGSDDAVLTTPGSVIDPRHPSGLLSDVRAISVGVVHSCAAHFDGRVSCWGSDRDGNLGNGVAGNGVQAPVAVSGIDNAVEVCAASASSCVRDDLGSVYCWGNNYRGQLGNPEHDESYVPLRVPGLAPTQSVDCAERFVCAVTRDGNVWCWGENARGQLGDVTVINRPSPVRVVGVADAVQVVTSRDHACALIRGGTVRCWGNNDWGQRGNAMTGGPDQGATRVLSYSGEVLTDVVAIAVGGGDDNTNDGQLDEAAHSCALLRDGNVYCWGGNYAAQLGYGMWVNGAVVPNELTSVRYAVDEMPDGLQIAAGYQHTCATAVDGTLRCWGDGWVGQLSGETLRRITPFLVEGL